MINYLDAKEKSKLYLEKKKAINPIIIESDTKEGPYGWFIRYVDEKEHHRFEEIRAGRDSIVGYLGGWLLVFKENGRLFHLNYLFLREAVDYLDSYYSSDITELPTNDLLLTIFPQQRERYEGDCDLAKAISIERFCKRVLGSEW